MTKTILNIVGTVFVVLGIAGFVSPGLGGTHLSPAHNVIHIVSGALALWFGLRGTLHGARMFSWIFGLVYGLLGVAGMVLGHSGTASMHDMGADSKLLRSFPTCWNSAETITCCTSSSALCLSLLRSWRDHFRARSPKRRRCRKR